jgi:hypothetical protein
METTELAPQEEVDTNTMILLHASIAGFKQILIRTVDTDVVGICLYQLATHFFQRLNIDNLRIAFGMNFRYIYMPSEDCLYSIPKSFSLALFHALTGCNAIVGHVRSQKGPSGGLSVSMRAKM